jgi:hypothetical protein
LPPVVADAAGVQLEIQQVVVHTGSLRRWVRIQWRMALERVVALKKKLSAVSPRAWPKGRAEKIRCADNHIRPFRPDASIFPSRGPGGRDLWLFCITNNLRDR